MFALISKAHEVVVLPYSGLITALLCRITTISGLHGLRGIEINEFIQRRVNPMAEGPKAMRVRDGWRDQQVWKRKDRGSMRAMINCIWNRN